MANVIRHKRGTSDPSASDFSNTAELLVNTTDGGLFTKDDSDNVVEIGTAGSLDYCNLKKSSLSEDINQLGVTNKVAIGFDAEVAKASIYTHSNSTNPEKVTVTSAGFYMINVTIGYDNTGANRVSPIVSLSKNGTEITETRASSYSRGSGNGDEKALQINTVLELAVNDYLEVYAWQDHRNQTDAVNTIVGECEFVLTRLSAVAASSGMTAASILTSVKTVDGTGSGLDADTLDGVQGSSFLRSDANDNVGGVLTFTSGSGLNLSTNDIYLNARVINNQAGGSDDGLYIGYNNANSGITRLYGGGATSGGLDVRGSGVDDVKIAGNKVWNEGNDGTGSGLDADTLDGIEATSFLRSDADDTCSEKLTFSQTGSSQFIETPSGVTLGSVGTWSKDIIFGNCDQIRFTNTSNWNWNEWGGILYDHSATTMYIGGPAATQFDSNASPPPSNIDVDFVGLNASGLKKDGNTVWHAGNDGSGSGLDADKLDGLQATSFARTTGTSTLGTLIDCGANPDGSTVQLNLGRRDSNSTGDPSLVYIDMTTDDTFKDYGLRFIRFADSDSSPAGSDGNNTSRISHRGTGELQIQCEEAADTVFKRAGTTRLKVTWSGISVYSSVYESSDISLKDNVSTLENVLESIKQIRGVNFTWKEDGRKSVGVIAQEVETVFPELITEDEGVKGVSHSGLVGVLIEAVKELSDRVTALESG